MLKSDRLVCEKNATKAQPVTNCNLVSINSVYFNYEVNLLIVCGRIFVTIGLTIPGKLVFRNLADFVKSGRFHEILRHSLPTALHETEEFLLSYLIYKVFRWIS